MTQKGSTVGSIAGNVTIEANKDVHVNASDIIAGKDISMTGENVNISSKDNIYHSEEKHEYKKSGLTVSVGGAGIEAIESVAAPATRMTEVSDHRLKALYGYETAEKIKENGDALKAAAKGNFSPTVSIGITSSSSKSESHSTITEAQGSSLQAGQDMTIKTKEDLNVKGSDIVGNHIHLEADNDIHIWATEEKETQKSSQSSKGGSLGVSLSAGSVVSVDGKFYAGKGKENGRTTSYRASTVNANDTLTMKSGKDTDLIGSTVSGNKVKADVYGNLNIESLQTKKEYSEENISAGMSFSTAAGKTSYGGSASKGNMKSHYESVINQAGIRAGGEGFDISVKENTDLKGGVIDSAASKDKNTLTTGTLSWEDKENRANYSSKGIGVSYSHYGDYDQMTQKQKNEVYNKKGLTPSISSGAQGKAKSTTLSAVAEGTIKITDRNKQKQDLADLNRNTSNSLNQLGEIFDKQKIEEREEMAGLFGKIAYNAIHNMKDGNKKTVMHALTGGIMSQLSNGNFMAGATSASLNKMLMNEIKKVSNGDPATMQWMNAIVGGIASELVAGNGQIGASVASNATTNNSLRDAIEAINGTFDASEAYEEVKIDNDQELDDNTFDIGVGNEENVWEEAKLYEPSSNSFDNTLTENMGDTALEKSEEIAVEKIISWGTANYFEANDDFLNRKEAEQIGRDFGNRALKTWSGISYLKDVSENQQRFNTLYNKLRADIYDTLPISAGIAGAAIGGQVGGSCLSFAFGGIMGGIVNGYVENSKSEWQKEEQKGQDKLNEATGTESRGK